MPSNPAPKSASNRSLFFALALIASIFLVDKVVDFFHDENPLMPNDFQEGSVLVEPNRDFALEGSSEEFYLLQSPYQQWVFSSLGGSVAEINLPFKSSQNPLSIVLPTSFDQKIAKDSPENALFPLHAFKVFEDGAVVEKTQGSLGGYYPLLRRPFVGFRHNQREYHALSIGLDDQSLDSAVYTVTHFDGRSIEFQYSDSKRRITKRFSIPDDPQAAPYCLDLVILVEGDLQGSWLTTGFAETELISGSAAPTMKYRMLRKNKRGVVENVSLPEKAQFFPSIYPDWVASSNGFFGIIVDPITEMGAGFRAVEVDGVELPSRLSLIDSRYNLYPAEKYPGYSFELPLRGTKTQLRFFAGPFEAGLLKKLDHHYASPGYSPNYSDAISSQGWFSFISAPFGKFLYLLMQLFYMLTSSWGLSIILLTLALRILLYPLNAWSIRSTLKMQEIAPLVAKIQAKYKNDPRAAQMEIMLLYREKGINPITGCLPLLAQFPFLIGMMDVLRTAFDLRGASFIPGWITDLTAPDVIFSWSRPLFFVGNSLHLLPFLLLGLMYWQQRLSAPAAAGVPSDQQRQQRLTGNIMTVLFTIIFYHFPSGLNLYWLSSMMLSILQQWYMSKRAKPVVVNSKGVRTVDISPIKRKG